jgi:hypothetical protein
MQNSWRLIYTNDSQVSSVQLEIEYVCTANNSTKKPRYQKYRKILAKQ